MAIIELGIHTPVLDGLEQGNPNNYLVISPIIIPSSIRQERQVELILWHTNQPHSMHVHQLNMEQHLCHGCHLCSTVCLHQTYLQVRKLGVWRVRTTATEQDTAPIMASAFAPRRPIKPISTVLFKSQAMPTST